MNNSTPDLTAVVDRRRSSRPKDTVRTLFCRDAGMMVACFRLVIMPYKDFVAIFRSSSGDKP